MKRRWFAVAGTTFFLVVAIVAVMFGVPAAAYPTIVLFGATSVLFVLGGLDPVPGALPWYRFLGLGVMTLGVVAAGYWFEPISGGPLTAADLVPATIGVATVLLFGFMGVDWFRGGHHFDLSRIEPGPILGRGDGERR